MMAVFQELTRTLGIIQKAQQDGSSTQKLSLTPTPPWLSCLVLESKGDDPVSGCG